MYSIIVSTHFDSLKHNCTIKTQKKHGSELAFLLLCCCTHVSQNILDHSSRSLLVTDRHTPFLKHGAIK
jgi:hypothetical protein